MTKKILILAGDGIGPEVCAEVIKIIQWFNKNYNCNFEIEEDLIGGCAYDQYGTPLDDNTIKLAKDSNAILLGAVGGPKWESLDISKRPEKGLLNIRKELDLFANLRPAITFPQLLHASSLKADLVSNLDIMIVRELTGGIYFGKPRGVEKTKDGEFRGVNSMVYTSQEVKRVAHVAFDIASQRNNKVCSVDKANVLEVTEMWRDEVTKLAKQKYKNIDLSHMYVDNAAMQLVRNPKQFDVIVTSNMFGDILSDIAAMLTGSLGMLPSASLGDEIKGKRYALYEPVHGSAPDIAGQNVANPLATILSFEMMLRYSLNMEDIANKLNFAVKEVLASNYRTIDIYEDNMTKVSTSEMGDLIIDRLNNIS